MTQATSDSAGPAMIDPGNDSGVAPGLRTDPFGELALGVFGKYRLVQKIGAGGMAQVFLASIDGPDGFSKKCAVKTILPEFASLEDFARMFVTEAKVAALLNHPNVVQVYDFGKVDSRYYLAMEWVDGVSLHQLLRQAARQKFVLGPRTAVNVAIAMCDALAYVQEAVGPDGQPLHIVHRDVTPGNVLVSTTGVVKLTDFGVVRTVFNHHASNAGVIKGKYAYMSPEQVRGQPMDHRSDLFSLGVVLYEVSTGRRLFKRESIAETVTAVSGAIVPPPSTFIPGFPEGFERVLLKALSLDPDDRYPSAREMLADLDAFRGAQQWTSSTRELAALVSTLFPELSASSPAMVELGQLSDGGEQSLPGVEVELASIRRRQRWGEAWVVPFVAASAAAASGLFWYWWLG